MILSVIITTMIIKIIQTFGENEPMYTTMVLNLEGRGREF